MARAIARIENEMRRLPAKAQERPHGLLLDRARAEAREEIQRRSRELGERIVKPGALDTSSCGP
jgi:hypothetical protein